MVYKISQFTENTDVQSVLDDAGLENLFPKIIWLSDNQQVFLYDLQDQTNYVVGGSEMSIIYPSTDTGLVFGDDYSTMIFSSFDKNYVFTKPLPAPVLQGSLTAAFVPSLSWTSSYRIPTKVYRTEVFQTSSFPGSTPADANFAPSEYTPVTEVPGYTVSQQGSTYQDNSVVLNEGQSISYYVENENGISDAIKVSRPTT